MKTKVLLTIAVCVALVGCTNTGKTGGSPLIPDKAIRLTANTSISLSTLLVGAAIYAYYDPLAPNWEIEEARLDDETYRFSMKMKRYHTGGSGESIQILKRRANQIQREQGFGGYQILEYSEGIDSQTIGARRVAEGTIKLVRPQQADSFMLN